MIFSIIFVLIALIFVFFIPVIIKSIILLFMDSSDNRLNSRIISIDGHKENIEFILRNEVSKAKWENSDENSDIICLDCGMDDETKKICSLMSKDYEFIRIEKQNIDCN